MLTLFLSFLRLGLTAFGGPAMVAHIKEMSVIRNKWLDNETFNDGVALCQSIPGATAMQMAAYVGLKANGVAGALLCYLGFGLPAFILMLMLSAMYAEAHNIPQVISVFKGLQVAVVAIVANATILFGRTAMKDLKGVALALAASVLFWLGVSPFIVVIGAGAAGAIFSGRVAAASSSLSNTAKKCEVLRGVFWLFLAVAFSLLMLFSVAPRLCRLALLMIKVDLFAFGGGFASLPLMLNEIVNVKGWMDFKTFMDGIALGQVTPGPIVITSTFIGYMLYGVPGAFVATAAIFTPSFLILVATVPIFDMLKGSIFYHGAVKGVLASFVGLLLFVTLKFASAVPWDLMRMIVTCGLFVLLIKKVDIFYVVIVAAVISALIF